MADRPPLAKGYSNVLVYVKQAYLLQRKHELILQSLWEHMLTALVLGLIFMVNGVNLLQPSCCSKLGRYYNDSVIETSISLPG